MCTYNDVTGKIATVSTGRSLMVDLKEGYGGDVP